MTRPGLIVFLIALIGFALSGLAAWQSFDQQRSVQRTALEQAAVAHTRLVQERVSERELLTRVAVGLFRASSEPNALQPLRSSLYAFKTDFVLATWIARVPSSEFAAVAGKLEASGFYNTQLRRSDDAPLDLAKVGGTLDVIMDVEPMTSQTLGFPGRTVDPASATGAALRNAVTSGGPSSSDPVVLFGPGGPLGVILAAPVFSSQSGNQAAGFITFSYQLGPLLLTSDASAPFSLALRDPRSAGIELVSDPQGQVRAVSSRGREGVVDESIQNVVRFGGRDWTLRYAPRQGASDAVIATAAMVGLIGVVLTAAICSLFGYVAFSNLRLQREIEARLSYEHRLGAVIGELNHRVKNILAVIQSIVTRTLRSDSDVDEVRDLLIGRIHAMSNVVSLLSDSQWQGVRLRSLLQSRSIPNFEHAVVSGPDISVSSRAAQSLSLLFYELASHAEDENAQGVLLGAQHNALKSSPSIVVQWRVDGEDKKEMFHLRWEEFNATQQTRRKENDFGTILLDRVAPEAVGGTSKRYFTDVSYVYELTAPMDAVVDKTELDRTLRFTLPASPAQR